MKCLRMELISDGTFGRGDGVPGIVDEEIDYDSKTGLPVIKGRTVKGLLVEECSNVLFSVRRVAPTFAAQLEDAAQRLFGSGGSTVEDEGWLHFGEACMETEVVQAVNRIMQAAHPIADPTEILDSLTGIRRRSMMNEETEAPADETLRSVRVLIRGTVFYSPLVELGQLKETDWHLLAASAAALRRGGKSRNRGAGRLDCSLWDDRRDVTREYFAEFLKNVDSTSKAT